VDKAWNVELRNLRETAGLTRAELAERGAVSEASIRAYETGRRHPARQTLGALLDALKVEPIRRHYIQAGAGYATDGGIVAVLPAGPDYTVAEAEAEIQRYPWPAHLNNEMFEVVATNPLMEAVWGVGMADRVSSPERSFIVALSTKQFADRILNWDEAMTLVARMIKGSHTEASVESNAMNPYLASIAQQFLMGDPGYVQRFLRIWATCPPLAQKRRFVFPLTWDHSDLGRMEFWIVVNPANLEDYMTFCEWMPADGTTAQKLDSLKDGLASSAPSG
jgi:transcriptional regulator with XRE-family HTH domain